MDKLQVLNHRQIAWFIGALVITGNTISLPSSIVRFAGVDAWFSHLGPILYAFLICYFFYLLTLIYPGLHIFEIIDKVCGKWIGFIINIVILFHIWLVLVRDIAGFGFFVQAAILPTTPLEIVIIIFMVIIVYYARSGIEVTARVSDIFFPIFIIIILLLFIMLEGEFALERLSPVLGSGLAPVLVSNLLNLGWYADIIFIGAFLHTLQQSKLFYASLRHGVLLSAFILSLILFLIVAVLGAEITERSLFPIYTMVQQIRMTEFMDRIELFMFCIWFPIFIVKLSFIFTTFLIGLSHFIQDKNYHVYSIHAGGIILATSLIAFDNVMQIFYIGNYSSNIVFMTYPPLLLITIYVIARQKNKNSRLISKREITKRAINQKKQERTLWQKVKDVSDQKWRNSSKGLIIGCLFFIGFGVMLGSSYFIYGMIAGLGYALCLSLALIFSYLEMIKINNDLMEKYNQDNKNSLKI